MKFISRSLLILFLLYGLVFAIGDLYLAHAGAPLWIALAFPVALIMFQFLIGPTAIEWLMDISWDAMGLPETNREFLARLCAERGLKVPRIGIIYSGTPNAFSFGHLRSDARIVVTKGLIDILTPEETNAVLAHELGHIEHWDFALMAVAALAPMLLYQFYVFTHRINNARAVAYAAYVCYLVSQFVVLLLNRTREYFADHYAADVTHSPDVLSSALVKIAYGMVTADGEYRRALASGSKEEKAHWRREYRLGGSLALMGISNLRSGAALALGSANPADAAAVMRWDLVNPWSRVYELNSTHPLTALRVRALNKKATELHQAPQYSLPQDDHMRWGGFPLEVALWAAPFLGALALGAAVFMTAWLRLVHVALPPNTEPVLLIFIGVTWMLRILYRYRGEFEDSSIGSLIQDLEVSQMRAAGGAPPRRNPWSWTAGRILEP